MSSLRCVIFRGREDKLAELGRHFSDFLKGDVLDVGCDAKYLASSVQGRYFGVDLAGSPDIRLNLEAFLPFHDRSFDTVVAFDVLEHLNRLHFAFDELCRVSRSYLIIGLPNLYEWHFRLMFLVGRKLSGKYGLPHDPPFDRHKWLFSLREARNFVRERGDKHGFSIIDETFGYYAYQRLLPKLMTTLGKMLTPRGASVFAYHYWVVLKRDYEQ